MALLMLALTPVAKAEEFSAKDVVLEHIKDSHEWHITDIGEGKPLVIPLPVIVKSSTGWHVFCSSRFEHHADADGLRHVKADAPADIQGLAIATEGEVANVTSGAFTRKYHLPSASSVNSAVKGLLAKDFITQGKNGYQAYDKLFALWVKRYMNI